VGYVRVSTEQQAEGGVSVAAQCAKLRAYAEACELDLVAIEQDAGVSAKSLKRPGLQAALRRLEGGEVEGLLVAKLDRLTRSVRDLAVLLEPARFGGRWQLLSVGDSIDTRSAAGRLVLNVLGSVSQWERETAGERTREALAHLRVQGAVLGGEALGWRRTCERDPHGRCMVARDDAEAMTVARIRELRSQGLSLRAIAARLRDDGHRTKRGGCWAPQTVSNVLTRLGAERSAA
jgi:site-specific DNA recombinase